MITSGILSLIIKIVTPLFDFLESVPVVLVPEYIDAVLDWCAGILYFFPMGTVSTILNIIMVTWTIRVVIAFLRTLWSIVPFT